MPETPPPRGPVAPPPAPADVGIVMALPIEAGPLKARLKDVRTIRAGRLSVIEGLLADRLVALVVTGPGQDAARRGLDLLFAGHRPRWVLSAGFGGALHPDLPRYALVTPSHVGTAAGEWLATGLEPGDVGPFRSGRLLTLEQIARTATEKAALRSAYSAADYRRLTGIKAVYDPQNTFRLNHNIPPGRGPIQD